MPLPVYEVLAIRVNTTKSTNIFSSVCIVYVSANTLSINWKFYNNKKTIFLPKMGKDAGMLNHLSTKMWY